MFKFKIGDSVVVDDPDMFTNGQWYGIFEVVDTNYNYSCVAIRNNAGKIGCFSMSHISHSKEKMKSTDKIYMVVIPDCNDVNDNYIGNQVLNREFKTLRSAEEAIDKLSEDEWDFDKDDVVYIVKVTNKYRAKTSFNFVEDID